MPISIETDFAPGSRNEIVREHSARQRLELNNFRLTWEATKQRFDIPQYAHKRVHHKYDIISIPIIDWRPSK